MAEGYDIEKRLTEARRVSAAALSDNGWEASERAANYVVNALVKAGLLSPAPHIPNDVERKG